MVTLLQLLTQAQTIQQPEKINLLARVCAATLAFLVTYFFTILELITSKYPKTYTFILTKCQLHIYGTIYGIFSFIIFILLDELIQSQNLKIAGLSLSNIWVKAFLIGVSAKGLMKIRLWTINLDSTSFPVGMDSIVQLFEPWLLQEIELKEYNAVKRYLRNYTERWNDLDEVKNKVNNNIPLRSLSDVEKKTFKIDVDEAKSIPDVMELYLRKFGQETFERVFHL